MKSNYYFEKILGLMKEAFSFKKYKKLNPILAILCGLAVLPFVILFLVFGIAGLLIGFVFNIITQPAKYLHSIVNKEGQAVKHATQAVLYFVSWPTIIFLYGISALLTIVINICYTFASITGYIWTLSGYKFHLLLSNDPVEKEEIGRIESVLALVFGVIGLALLSLTIVFCFCDPIEASMILQWVYLLFVILFAVVGFNYKANELPVSEEEPEEETSSENDGYSDY